jgi:hypothetical protein
MTARVLSEYFNQVVAIDRDVKAPGSVHFLAGKSAGISVFSAPLSSVI